MLTVQNDWIEYETEPVPARRVAVRGGAACAQRGPVGAQRVLTPAVLAPVARPRAGRGVGSARVRRTTPAAPAHRSSRLRLTRRGRVVLVVLPSLLLLSGAVLAAAPGVAQAAQPSSPASVVAPEAAPATVVVGSGDSLWTIAQRVAPHTDPRVAVAAIQRANHLAGTVLQAGDRLVLPAAG